MSNFRPFAPSPSAATAGNMTFTCEQGRVRVDGDIQLTRDRVGLDAARALEAIADALVAALPAAASARSPVDPYAEDSSSVSVGAMTVENGLDRIAFYGTDTIGHDAAGAVVAATIRALASAIVATLSADRGLPDKVAVTATVDTVPNPFG